MSSDNINLFSVLIRGVAYLQQSEKWMILGIFSMDGRVKKKITVDTHSAPKYLGNIVEIFRGNIVKLLKYFETYH